MTLNKDNLTVKINDTRDAMGYEAACDIAQAINEALEQKDEINMIFAAAPSQNDMLRHLCEREDISWERINAFHMDEYIGLSPDAPQCFSRFLERYIFNLKPFKSINLIDPGAPDAQAECERYASLLNAVDIDIVCMGIGENGHIAFNDPHVALFDDPETVKVVELDEKCRMQQVNDGCFKSIAEVPKYALTLTIPTLMKASRHFCVVPAATKAEAVKRTLNGDISTECPATILRNKENSILYCDADSSSLL